MADELNFKRIIELQQKTSPEEGDSFAVDNATSGTNRITIQNLLDPTFSSDMKAAPAAATKEKIDEVMDVFAAGITEAVDDWLDQHPEATTTVQDGSLTYKKLVTGTLGFVTPEMFGAVGDGVTDDTVAIQNAINTGKLVLFEKKNYLITDALNVYSGSVLVGQGSSSIIEISQTVAIGKCITTSENNLSDITILSLFFKGHCDENTDDESGLVTIELLHANNIDIENCLFSGFHKNIELTVCTNCRVVNNKILNATEMATSKINGYGILLERGNNIVIDNNTMEEIERHAIYVNAATDVVITNNIISAKATNKGSGYEGNIKINGAKNIIVTNNNIQGNGYGIGLLGELTEGSTFGCEKVTIANNIVHDCIINVGFARGLIGCCSDREYFDIVIRDNILYMSEVPNFTIRGINIDQGTFKNLQIKNNVIDKTSVGIYVKQTELVVVNGNICKNCNTAYSFYNDGSKIFGDVNYHTNCTNGISGTAAQLRRSYMSTGIIDTDSANHIILSAGDIIVQADKANVFTGPSSGYANITNISGGIPGEIVTFRCAAEGSVRIALNASTTMKLDASKGNFTGAVGIIQFKKIDTTWFEICRTAI